MCKAPSCGSSILPQKLFRFTDNYPNTQGKATLSDFLDVNTNVGYLTEKVKDEDWDYVILQEFSLNPSLYPIKYEDNVVAVSRYFEKCKQFILFENWAYQEGNPRLKLYDLTHDSMYIKTKSACERIAKKYGFQIARIGEIFYKVENEIDLYSSDGCHPSIIGSTLAGYIIADIICSSYYAASYLSETIDC